jgi:MSHA biogenesis protein MshP
MSRRRHTGLGAIAAIVVLVLLAVLAATVMRISFSAQSTAAQSLQAARAGYAARAGLEWGMRQVLQGAWEDCPGNPSQTLDLRSANGMRVTVRCSISMYSEAGTNNVRIYELVAVACNGSAATCPDNTAALGLHYVERERRLLVSD